MLIEFHSSLWIIIIGIAIISIGSVAMILPPRHSHVNPHWIYHRYPLLISVGTIILSVGLVLLIGSQVTME